MKRSYSNGFETVTDTIAGVTTITDAEQGYYKNMGEENTFSRRMAIYNHLSTAVYFQDNTGIVSSIPPIARNSNFPAGGGNITIVVKTRTVDGNIRVKNINIHEQYLVKHYAIYIPELAGVISRVNDKTVMNIVNRYSREYADNERLDIIANSKDDILVKLKANIHCIDSNNNTLYCMVNGEMLHTKITNDTSQKEYVTLIVRRGDVTTSYNIVYSDQSGAVLSKDDLSKLKVLPVTLDKNNPYSIWFLGLDRDAVYTAHKENLAKLGSADKTNGISRSEVNDLIAKETSNLQNKIAEHDATIIQLTKEKENLVKELEYYRSRLNTVEKTETDKIKLNEYEMRREINAQAINKARSDAEIAKELNELKLKQLQQADKTETKVAELKVEKEQASASTAQANFASSFVKAAAVIVPIIAGLCGIIYVATSRGRDHVDLASTERCVFDETKKITSLHDFYDKVTDIIAANEVTDSVASLNSPLVNEVKDIFVSDINKATSLNLVSHHYPVTSTTSSSGGGGGGDGIISSVCSAGASLISGAVSIGSSIIGGIGSAIGGFFDLF